MEFLVDFEWRKPRDSRCYELWAAEQFPSKVIIYPRQKVISDPRHGRRGSYKPPMRRAQAQWGYAYHPFGILFLPAPLRSKGKVALPHYVWRQGKRERDGDLEPYRPVQEFGPLLVTEFLGIYTPEDVLKFVQRFGALTAAGLDPAEGELAEGVIAHADVMREFLAIAESGNRFAKSDLADTDNEYSKLEVRLAVDPTDDQLTLRFVPGSLLDAIWLHAIQKVLSGTIVRQCEDCGKLFEAGQGTRRRRDAKFCSEQHKIRYHSLKRSRKA